MSFAQVGIGINSPNPNAILDDVSSFNQRCFANTINVINGGLECGSSNDNAAVDNKVSRRVAFFKQYSLKLGYDNKYTDDKLKCFDLTPNSF